MPNVHVHVRSWDTRNCSQPSGIYPICYTSSSAISCVRANCTEWDDRHVHVRNTELSNGNEINCLTMITHSLCIVFFTNLTQVSNSCYNLSKLDSSSNQNYVLVKPLAKVFTCNTQMGCVVWLACTTADIQIIVVLLAFTVYSFLPNRNIPLSTFW